MRTRELKIEQLAELPRHKTREYSKRPSLKKIRWIVIHHGYSRQGEEEMLRAYARYHVETLGWPAIGYHYGITTSGRTFKLNPLSLCTYHTARYNKYAVGIVLVGNFDRDSFTYPQKDALIDLLAHLCDSLRLNPIEAIRGHREFPGVVKTCPGVNIDLNEVREKTRLALEPQKIVLVRYGERELVGLLKEGRAYVPVRGLVEALGYSLSVTTRPKQLIIEIHKEEGGA